MNINKLRAYNFFKPKRPFSSSSSSSPLPIDPSSPNAVPRADNYNKVRCFTLADHLVSRGLLSSAQKLIQRMIFQSSSVSQALSVVEFAVSRGMDLHSSTIAFLMRKPVSFAEAQLCQTLYTDWISRRVIQPDFNLLNLLVICYCKLGNLDDAISLSDRIFEMKFVPLNAACNAFIYGLCAQGRILELYRYFNRVNDAGVVLGHGCYKRLAAGLCDKGYLDEALYVFDSMCDKGVTPTVYLCKLLVYGFCNSGRIHEAESLSMKMEAFGVVLDKVMGTSIIHGYCKNKNLEMAMRVFIKMLKLGCEPDNFTYNTLIQGFVKLGLYDKGWVLHRHMAESGLVPDPIFYQVMISQYCIDRKVDCALALMSNMNQCNIIPTIQSYTILMNALYKENRLDEADRLYMELIGMGFIPDHVVCFVLIKSHQPGCEINLALALVQAIAKNGCGIDLSVSIRPMISETTENVILEVELLLFEISRRNRVQATTAFSIYMMALSAARKLDKALICLNKMASFGCSQCSLLIIP